MTPDAEKLALEELKGTLHEGHCMSLAYG